MKRIIWKAEDIIAGLWLIRNSSTNVKEDPGFASTVTFVISWRMDGPGNQYGLTNQLTDGMFLDYGSKAQMAKKLNEDEFGYRAITKEEVMILIERMPRTRLA